MSVEVAAGSLAWLFDAHAVKTKLAVRVAESNNRLATAIASTGKVGHIEASLHLEQLHCPVA